MPSKDQAAINLIRVCATTIGPEDAGRQTRCLPVNRLLMSRRDVGGPLETARYCCDRC
ncbi:hypothetical protein SynBIOSE41_03122 [Synechococcus sp. BIOS-E4-1]|nr:hypothetical protein SynBIOSE41_03122 [Synechococcus sp. BIOS-E4-1]